MFDKPTFQTYYMSIDRLVSARLAKEQPGYLVQVDFDEFLNHFRSTRT
jgi:hypothetical protein